MDVRFHQLVRHYNKLDNLGALWSGQRGGVAVARIKYEFNSWFARDVTKNQTKKLSIVLSFYFPEVLQYLNIFT